MRSVPVHRRAVLKLFGSAAAMSVLLNACGAGPTPSTTAGNAGSTPAGASSATGSQAAPTAAQQAAASPTTAAQQAAAATPTTGQAATGSASGPTPTPNPLASVPIKSGKKVVEWWFGWGGMTALNTFAALGKDFNAKHDDFQVKPLQVSSISQKLLAAIAGGTAPAAETGNLVWSQYWVTGAALPLDDYIKKSSTIQFGDFFEQNVAGGQWKGKTYGIPAVEAFVRVGLCINQDSLSKGGISANDLPMDFDSLYAFAKATTEVESSGAVKAVGIDILDAEGGNFWYWTNAFNLPYYDTEKQKYNFDNDQTTAIFTTIQKFVDITGADKLAGFTNSYGTWTESPTAMLPSGVEMANLNGYWAPGELSKSAPGHKFVYGWIPTPKGKSQKLQIMGGHYGILPKGGSDPDLGFQVLEYVVSKDAMKVLFDGTGWIGARKSFLQQIDVNQYQGLSFYVDSATKATSLQPLLVDPVQAFVTDQWSKVQDSVIYHKMTPKGAAAQLQKAVDIEMKQQFPSGI